MPRTATEQADFACNQDVDIRINNQAFTLLNWESCTHPAAARVEFDMVEFVINRIIDVECDRVLMRELGND